MVIIRKEKGENPQRVVFRFTQALKKSGVLFEARKRMFRDRVVSNSKRKASAMHRLQKKKHYQELARLGKLTPKRWNR